MVPLLLEFTSAHFPIARPNDAFCSPPYRLLCKVHLCIFLHKAGIPDSPVPISRAAVVPTSCKSNMRDIPRRGRRCWRCGQVCSPGTSVKVSYVERQYLVPVSLE